MINLFQGEGLMLQQNLELKERYVARMNELLATYSLVIVPRKEVESILRHIQPQSASERA